MALLGRDELFLCDLLRFSINKNNWKKNNVKDLSLSGGEWQNAAKMAAKHGVLPLLYDAFCALEMEDAAAMAKDGAFKAACQWYHLLFMSKYLTNLFLDNGIKTALLKGCATACLYPVPEYRKSGDVDLLFEDEKEAGKAYELLKNRGFFAAKDQHAGHHIAVISPDGIEIELHSALAEPFDNDKINGYLRGRQRDFLDRSSRKQIMGVKLPVLSEAHHAFFLAIHMLQHFLRAGFGIKLLCDWTVFWNRDVPENEKEEFWRLSKESGISGFIKAITGACVLYMGLDAKNMSFIMREDEIDEKGAEELMGDIFEAEEFGRSSADRMVAVRDGSVLAYAREFHHQMKLTYPKASKIVVAWPALWAMTLAGFLYRNKKIRKVSSASVLKNAAKRSRLTEKMKLFE